MGDSGWENHWREASKPDRRGKVAAGNSNRQANALEGMKRSLQRPRPGSLVFISRKPRWEVIGNARSEMCYWEVNLAAFMD